MGIHWRTRVLAPNVSALAKAAWDQTGWSEAAREFANRPKRRGPEGAVGGAVAVFPGDTKIADTKEPNLYHTVRYDVEAYHLDVPNGMYQVTLKLCEPFHKEPNRRVFGAKVQGQVLFENLDLFARVGRNRAIDFTAQKVRVTDGRLKIDFIYQTELPCIAGIVVEGTTAGSDQSPGKPYVRKINCGGPAYEDYAADLPTIPNTKPPRFLPVDDFYLDWARSEFGSEAAEPIAAIFTHVDGHTPRPADWVTGPGSMRLDERPWQQVQKEYAFVDRLAALRPKIAGPGNLERFDYWLNTFRSLRAIAKTRCAWGQYNAALAKVKAEKNPEMQKKLAHELALPLRKQLVAAFAELNRYVLATASNDGELGNICNWQQQTMPVLLTAPGEEFAKLLGEPLPPDAVPSKHYLGQPRLFVPEVRTGITAGEPLSVKVIVLGVKPDAADLYWRPLGAGAFAKTPLVHVARGVYTVALPAEAVKADFEYYVEAVSGGSKLVFPPTAPALNQTVVVSD
jgi:hypothetical protein